MRLFLTLTIALLIPTLAFGQSHQGPNPPFVATGSTTPRTPMDRAADVANILDNGGDPTGASDNSGALLKALQTGKQVWVPSGTYAFSNKTIIPSGTSAIRCDRGATFKAIAGNTSNALFFTADSTVTKLTVSGCSFNGNSSSAELNTVFFQIYQASNVVFDDCYFYDNPYVIAGFTQATNSGIKNSRFDNVGNYGKGTGNYPLTVTVAFSTSGTNNFFTGNTLTNIGGDPFDAFNQTGFKAIGNSVVGDNTGFVHQTTAAGIGMYLYGNSPGSVFADNYVYGMTGNGIDLNCVSGVSVFGNVVLHSGGAGISLSANGSTDASPCSPTMKGNSIGSNVASNNFQAVAGATTLTANASTAVGSAVLNFASTTGVSDGMFIYDASGSIPVGTKVSSHTSTTVTANATATGSGVANGASIQFLNSYPRQPAPNAGLWIGCVNGPCVMDSLVVSGNMLTDSQAAPTQPYGVFKSSNLTLTNYKLGANNTIVGNVTAPTLNVFLQDQGTGSNAWACWPGNNITASGSFGSMACGFNAVASGVGALAMGTGVTSSGTYGATFGSGAYDRGYVGRDCYASGQFSTGGDAQGCSVILRGTGASTGAIRLTSNGSAASSSNCLNIPSNAGYHIIVDAVAFDHTTVSKNEAWSSWSGLLTQGAGAATTAVSMSATPTPLTNGTVTGSAIAATADATNGCLNLSFTPPTSNTDTWNVVARVRTVEVQ